MDEFSIQILLSSAEITLRDVVCRGTCRHRSTEECATTTHLVFPYRGTYVRHVGQDNAVADANQLTLFNSGEGYQISHPIAGGDASLSLAVDQGLLRESRTPRSMPICGHFCAAKTGCAVSSGS